MVSVDKFENFPKVRADQIRKLVADSNTTDCLLDLFPSKLIKEHIDILLPLITIIVNLSLTNGTFPSSWKEVILIPMLKKYLLKLSTKTTDQ